MSFSSLRDAGAIIPRLADAVQAVLAAQDGYFGIARP
jgi:hypothetical protein